MIKIYFTGLSFTLAILVPGTHLIYAAPTKSQSDKLYVIKRTKNRIKVDHNLFQLQFIFRSPEQIAAFFYARGFPEVMIKKLKKVCFITAGMRNKSNNIIWLDIRKWKFKDKTGSLRRFDRAYWFAQWKQLQSPLRFQSTFRWTLIPTALDYRAGEREGGNITLQRRNQAITITAIVNLGKDKNSAPTKVVINNVNCANDAK